MGGLSPFLPPCFRRVLNGRIESVLASLFQESLLNGWIEPVLASLFQESLLNGRIEPVLASLFQESLLNGRIESVLASLFQESLLNGRIEPAGVVEGFSADLGASGDFCPRHVRVAVTAFFFRLSEDNAPSPYLVSVMRTRFANLLLLREWSKTSQSSCPAN